MKGESTSERQLEMEAIFGPNRDPEKIKQIREDVKNYEDTVRRQAALAKQARTKGRSVSKVDSSKK